MALSELNNQSNKCIVILTTKQRKRHIYFVINGKEPEDCKELDKATLEVLQRAFEQNTTRARSSVPSSSQGYIQK
jgi:hypothetical protein